MRSDPFKKMTNQQLAQRYIEIGLAQDEALLMDEYGKFNRLFESMRAIEKELQSRDGDQRRILLNLLSHPNEQVRLNTAKATLAIAPAEARRTLELLARARLGPQSGDAGMCLWALDEGIFKPT
ncbi:MAG: DUF2019 domain-containing protein [Pseudorhodoplanes sp.]|nr:hypothetical protein [Pseudorhodoplanes sp.]MBW7949852.1 DUF2019 domain-containing protein [Pseudorhodoplanes sp.]MCL4712834.1 DUF2019 domain-containing protein [Pseudorhodoplanes sp.]GIK80860.1 MAG: hypothetical protein BroJett024_19650 [Alphaproteobacteria bacterium]